MNVVEALNKRKSIRAYKPDPVPKDILVEVIEAAIRAPSWTDAQSWEFAIIGGKVMDEIKEVQHTRFVQKVPSQPDIPFPTLPERYLERARPNTAIRFDVQGIARDDQERRQAWSLFTARFFDAPNGIILYTEREIGPYAILDAGLVAQSINLAAVEYGLGTCMLAAAVNHPNEIRRILGIPESKLIIVGLSIGYPDWDHPVNNFRSLREPLDSVATWHGF